MTLYCPVCTPNGAVVAKLCDDGSPVEFFAEYDEMGSAWFTKSMQHASVMDLQYAVLIAHDLQAEE